MQKESESKKVFIMENVTVFDKPADIQATAKLVIKDFVRVMEASKPGKVYLSDPFMAGDTRLELRVHPNGFNEDYKGWVSVSLHNRSDGKIHVKGQLKTELKNSKKFDVEVGAGWGYVVDNLASHAMAKEFFKDRDFVLTAGVEIVSEDVKIFGTRVAPGGSRRLSYCEELCENLFEKMQGSDFTIVFNGVNVPCHKHVLAAASPVFEAMVENQHLEAIESKAKIELTEEVGRAFVKFIYTGDLDEGILKEHAVAFLELGDKYDVKVLKDLAEAEMLKQLDKKNMVEYVSIGDLFNAENLFEAALKMTKVNMSWLRSQVIS